MEDIAVGGRSRDYAKKTNLYLPNDIAYHCVWMCAYDI